MFNVILIRILQFLFLLLFGATLIEFVNPFILRGNHASGLILLLIVWVIYVWICTLIFQSFKSNKEEKVKLEKPPDDYPFPL